MHLPFPSLSLLLLAAAGAAQAALNGPCTAGSTPGVCVTTATCSGGGGTSHSGYCPNDPADVRCCTKTSCGSAGGNCRWTSQCSGTSVSGQSPPPPPGSPSRTSIDSLEFRPMPRPDRLQMLPIQRHRQPDDPDKQLQAPRRLQRQAHPRAVPRQGAHRVVLREQSRRPRAGARAGLDGAEPRSGRARDCRVGDE